MTIDRRDAQLTAAVLEWACRELRLNGHPAHPRVERLTAMLWAEVRTDEPVVAAGVLDVAHSDSPHGGGVRWASVAEVAVLLGVSPRAVQKRIARGALDARQVAGVWLVDRTDIAS